MTEKTKALLAHELNDRAKALDKATEQNPMELGAIAYTISNDRELLAELGFGSVKEWGEKTFGKKWKSIQNLAKVYAKLHIECGWETADIVGIGTVKANLLARLPESEIRKETWQKSAFTMNTSDFKQLVKSFLDTSPDHREGFCKVTFDAPRSFRDDTWKPTIAKGMASEGTEETYVVVEAALANYAIELQNEDVVNDRHTETAAGENAAPDPIDYGHIEYDVPDTPEAGSSESQAGESPTTT
jgi:hypothetical protein